MKHEECIFLLPDLRAGRLEPGLYAEVTTHLEDCEECRSLSRIQDIVATAARLEEAAGEGHPSAEEVVGFAVDARELAGDLTSEVEQHMASCATCKEEISRIRGVEMSLSDQAIVPRAWGVRTPEGVRGPRYWLTLAASILVAALVYPAYLGLVRLPSVKGTAHALAEDRGRLESERDDLAIALADHEARRGWSGGVRLQLLASGPRGEAVPSTVVVTEDPYIALGIDLEVPRGLVSDDVLRFEVRSRTGTSIMGVDQTVEVVKRDLGDTGVVTLLLSTDTITPGEYTLLVSAPGIPERGRVVQLEFVVVEGK